MSAETTFTIIPKTKGQAPLKNTVALIFSVVVFLMPIGVFLIFQYYINPQALEQKKRMIVELTNVDYNDNLALKNDVEQLADKISDLGSLLKNHKLTSQVFNLLRAICHKKVQFITVKIDPLYATILVDALTDQFRTFGEQLLALRDNLDIKEFSIKSAALSDKGVAFSFEIQIDPQLLLPGPDFQKNIIKQALAVPPKENVLLEGSISEEPPNVTP